MAGFLVKNHSDITNTCSSEPPPQSLDDESRKPAPQPLLLPPLQIQLGAVRHPSPTVQSEHEKVPVHYPNHTASETPAADDTLSHDTSTSENTYKRSIFDVPAEKSHTERLPGLVASPQNPERQEISDQGNPQYMDMRETEKLSEALHTMIELKEFLASAPTQFGPGEFIRQFRLPSEEAISCVRWKQVFCITGTDIVRSLVYRFSVIGRDVINRKKFEEGVFSDLRNLKINVDATLENPKSELLELLYKHHCVRTKKKQKVFFWYSVQHDQLFMDTLERELKREYACDSNYCNNSQHRMSPLNDPCLASGSPASTKAVREPALSFRFNNSIRLSEQISSITKGLPHDFATLVDATTKSLNAPRNVESTVASTTSAVPIPRHSRNVHSSSSEYTYFSHPMTPVRSVEKMSDRDSLISPWTNGRQQTAFASPDSLTSLSTPASAVSVRSASISPWTHVNNYGSHPGMDPSAVVSAVLFDSGFKGETGESDFPLEFLAQQDHEHQKPPFDFSFQNKYHDFVYNNRPALSLPSQTYHASQTKPFVEQDWGRGTIEIPHQFLDDRGSVAQHPLSLWRSGGQHNRALYPPFDYKPTRNSAAVRRGSGRIMKYSNAQSCPPSMSEGAFTHTY